MSLTLYELIERLASQYDIIELIEMLDINAEELLERFEDKIEKRFEQLEEEVEDEDEY